MLMTAETLRRSADVLLGAYTGAAPRDDTRLVCWTDHVTDPEAAARYWCRWVDPPSAPPARDGQCVRSKDRGHCFGGIDRSQGILGGGRGYTRPLSPRAMETRQ